MFKAILFELNGRKSTASTSVVTTIPLNLGETETDFLSDFEFIDPNTTIQQITPVQPPLFSIAGKIPALFSIAG